MNSPGQAALPKRLLVAIFVTAACFTIASSVSDAMLESIVPGAILLYFLLSLLYSPLFIRVAAAFMLFAGMLMLSTVSDPFALWAKGLNRSSGMFVLFLFLPLLTEMFTALANRSNPRSRPRKSEAVFPLLMAAGTQFVLSLVMSIGAVWMTGPLFQRCGINRKTSHRGISLGYAANVTVSPFDVIVHTTIFLSGMTYSRFVGGAAVAVLWYITVFFLIDFFRRRFRNKFGHKLDVHRKGRNTCPRPRRQNTRDISTPGASFHSFYIGYPDYGRFSEGVQVPTIVIGLLGGAYSLCWLAFTYGIGALRNAHLTIADAIPKYSGFLPLLVAASFLGAVLPETPASTLIETFVGAVVGLPQYIGILVIVVGTVLLAVLGIHMLVTIVIVGTVFTAESLGLTSLGFALVLIISYVSSMNLSPLVPFTALAATATELSTPITFVKNILLPWSIIILGTPILLILFFSR
jgi:hypothetical protein